VAARREECSAELRRLARVDNTWKAAIYPKGAAPIGLRLQAAD
jgi:ribosomal protein L25 (general stress protein Ctc)